LNWWMQQLDAIVAEAVLPMKRSCAFTLLLGRPASAYLEPRRNGQSCHQIVRLFDRWRSSIQPIVA
jgi:hypothetical protein